MATLNQTPVAYHLGMPIYRNGSRYQFAGERYRSLKAVRAHIDTLAGPGHEAAIEGEAIALQDVAALHTAAWNALSEARRVYAVVAADGDCIREAHLEVRRAEARLAIVAQLLSHSRSLLSPR